MNALSLAIVKLSLISLVGFYLYRRKIVDDTILRFLTTFLITITVPALIFSHLVEDLQGGLLGLVSAFLGLSVLIFATGLLLGFLVSFSKKELFRKEFMSAAAFQNCGYLPMNIAVFLFPPQQRETFLVYTFLYILGFNIIIWSIGSFLIFKKRGEAFHMKSLFTPPVTATLLALLFVYTKTARFVPSVIIDPLKMIGEVTFVLSMIILGCWLAKAELRTFVQRIGILSKLVVVKLLVMPLLFFAAVYKLEIFSFLGLFIVLQAAMPSAVSLPIVMSLRGADSKFASQGVFVTHVVSIVTVPFWLWLFLHVSQCSIQ